MIVSKRKQPDGSFLRTVGGVATAPKVTREERVHVARHRERVGSALKELIAWIVNIHATSTCQCKTLADEMDTWGGRGCETRRAYIVERLVSQRDLLAEALRTQTAAHAAIGWAIRIGIIPDAVLAAGASWLLTRAMEVAKDRKPPPKVVNSRIASGKLVRGIPISKLQNTLYQACISAPKPTPDPFIGEPVLHFGAHLWPIKGNWRWHAEKWSELSQQINGRCIVGVAIDASTDTLEEVRKALPERFELFEAPNTAEGESPTFRRLQEMIPDGPDDVLIYCHGKGVRAHTAGSDAVRIWTELMYETVTFNTDAIEERLAAGYQTFGAFRTFGDAPLSPRNRWHYSGTFFAVRAKHLRGKPVKPGYGGVEAWPGDHFPASHAWNERWDNRPLKAQYDLKAMYPQVVDDGMQWEVDRLGGPRCEQHKRELDWFLGKVGETFGCKARRMLVIGSKHGGLEYQIAVSVPWTETVSIDIAPQPDNGCEVIVGSSHDEAVREQARNRGPFDIVFVDGDHSYEGVRKDWEFALSLDPKLIAFHDIAKAVKHDREGCEVDRLWAEIKATHSTDEKIVGGGWGGIGVVNLKGKP